MTNIQKFNYQNQEIEFDLRDKNVMVNATEMAKAFGKDLFQFTKSDSTKSFISSCLKPANAGLLNIKNEEDLIISKQKSGTFMHRILALKFAAWLDPDFELWIYHTIDELLFGSLRQRDLILRDKTLKEMRISELEEKINKSLIESDDYKNLQKLKSETKALTKGLKNFDKEHIANQLELWQVEPKVI